MNVSSDAYGNIYGIFNKIDHISRLVAIAHLELYHARYDLQKILRSNCY